MKDLKMCVNSFNDANELKDDMKTLKDHGVQGRRLVILYNAIYFF